MKKWQKFVKLLRETDQPQGKGELCTAEGFCCLGLYMISEGFEYEITKDSITFEGESCYLTEQATKLLGVYNKYSANPSRRLSLAILNDKDKTFKEIADIIEQDPAEYFIVEE